MNSSCRAFAVGAFRFLLVTLLASVLLISTIVVVAYPIAWLQDGDGTDPQYLGVGMVCAMVFWLFMAVFHLRRETQTMPFSQADAFVAKAKAVLHDMGYALTSAQKNVLWFRPRFHSYLFGGGIQVIVDQHEARLTGPKMSLEIFRRSFRLLNHVQRVQLYLQEHRKFTDNVIKRVELQLRLRPEQFETVRKNVIELLQKEGDVICEVNLLVQSANGLREDMLEFQVREFLDQQGITCDIHKDIVQFVETVHTELEATVQ